MLMLLSEGPTCVRFAQARVSVSWDGRRVLAPPGVVDDEGFVDLRPYL